MRTGLCWGVCGSCWSGEYRKASSFLEQKVARIGHNKKHHLGDGLRRGPLNGAPEAVDWVSKGGVTPGG